MSGHRIYGYWPGNSVTRITTGVMSNLLARLDLRHERVWYFTTGGALGRKFHYCDFTFNNHVFNVAEWQRGVTPNSGTGFGDFALDWKSQRLFYSSVDHKYTLPFPRSGFVDIWQIRSVNYDGSGDTQLFADDIANYTQEGFGSGDSLILNNFRYDPRSNYLYFVALYRRTSDPSLGPSRNVSQIKRLDVVTGTVTTLFEIDPLTNFGNGVVYNIDLCFARNKMLWTQLVVNTTTSIYSIKHADLDGTNHTTVISQDDAASLPVRNRRFFYAKHSEVDDRIYFHSQGTSTVPVKNRLNSMKFDGTDERTNAVSSSISGVPVGDPSHIPDPGSGSWIVHLGCGFELTGDKYTGPA